MNYVTDQLILIFKDEISKNGNGSKTMTASAVDAVQEISREVTREWIESEVGIDEEKLRAQSLDTYVRVMTVLHGNNANGGIHSKPGQLTFRKHVASHGISSAKTVYDIPQFNWPADVSGYIVENAVGRIKTVFNEAISMIAQAVTSDFLESYVTVG